MLRSKRSGRILHLKRDISTRRVMHVTQKVGPNLPSLRHPEVLARVKQLSKACKLRGCPILATAIMRNHIHVGCCPKSREAMTNAMRYFFGELAKFLNRLWQRKGKVFIERYFSRAARSAKQCWRVINYILHNPRKAGIYPPSGYACDPFLTADLEATGAHRFLRGILGRGQPLRDLFVRFTQGAQPYERLQDRLQMPLFGGRSA